MTEMQKLIEDYHNDNRYIVKQMYHWLTPKEFKRAVKRRKGKNEKSRQNDKSNSKHR